ncbi:MAG: hypothetical protein AAFZ92_09130 [Pseudomonadota bacterium]
MTATSAIPSSYEEWRHCITVECGLKLTSNFIETRIATLQNQDDYHTKQFINLYGRDYHAIVVGWFLQAQQTV